METNGQGYWLKGGKLSDRVQAKLPPLNPAHCVWAVKDMFSNGTTTQLGIRVNPGDVPTVDEWDTREECLKYLTWLTQVPPRYGAMIEGLDGVLRTLADDEIASLVPPQTAPTRTAPEPLGAIVVTPLFKS